MIRLKLVMSDLRESVVVLNSRNKINYVLKFDCFGDLVLLKNGRNR